MGEAECNPRMKVKYKIRIAITPGYLVPACGVCDERTGWGMCTVQVTVGHPAQLTMGGCCSKCGIYPLLSPTSRDNLKTGDTPKLSRLQHKESFSNGHIKTNGTSGGHGANGEKNGGEPMGVTTPRSEDDTR